MITAPQTIDNIVLYDENIEQQLLGCILIENKVLQKIEKIIQEEIDKIGAMRVSMPIITDEKLWKESGRANSYGDEMLKIKDRAGHSLVYSPTNEEAVVDVFRGQITSYKQLPLSLYQINWKFRDEIRPRFGLMRAREFLMFDNYSFARRIWSG